MHIKKSYTRTAVKCLAAAAVLVLMTGCAKNRGLYQWGGYDAALYRSYKSPEAVVALQTQLERHIAAMNAGKRKVAPGLYAELGSLYLQAGKPEAAVEQYRNERELWPESRILMDALIQTLESRAKSKDGNINENKEKESAA